jgi:[acyl-carrier-protein] S-malonyltransferase/trans-AT polyketide synthase/acyltransferase/oxidoreductase domain-containing protein
MEGKSIAVVFPGQGSQRAGMGKDFFDNISVSRETFEDATRILGWDVAEMCFSGDGKLNLTEYAQPCIVTTEIAMLRGLQSLYGFNPLYFGGHSLGEYSALVAAGAMPLEEALRITQIRGQLMQKASPVGHGAMAAVISDTLDLEKLDGAIKDLPMDIANINSTRQVVLSGQSTAMPEIEKRLKEMVKESDAFRFVPLNVSAPFHSRFMETIKGSFKDTLAKLSEKLVPANARRVTSNFSGIFHTDSKREILDRLVSQLSGTVQWKKNMHVLAARADLIYEVGPGRPLRDFFKTIGVTCSSITTLQSARRLFEPPAPVGISDAG